MAIAPSSRQIHLNFLVYYHSLVFCSIFECADTEQILGRQVLRARFCGFDFDFLPAVRCGNQTWDGWVRSANAFSVLCRPPLPFIGSLEFLLKNCQSRSVDRIGIINPIQFFNYQNNHSCSWEHPNFEVVFSVLHSMAKLIKS